MEQLYYPPKFILHKLDTVPDITDAIISYLQAWRSDQSLKLDKEELQNILELQDEIGAHQFFEGWIHEGWECLQQQYYNKINSRGSSRTGPLL
jgi:predicted ATP-binding protein involved in virulence